MCLNPKSSSHEMENPSAESKHRKRREIFLLCRLYPAKLQSEEEISLEVKNPKTLIPFFEFLTIPESSLIAWHNDSNKRSVRSILFL